MIKVVRKIGDKYYLESWQVLKDYDCLLTSLYDNVVVKHNFDKTTHKKCIDIVKEITDITFDQLI